MKPVTVSVLASPVTGQPLDLMLEHTTGSKQREVLGNSQGERFVVDDGIAVLLNQADLHGNNQKCQRLYDRVAWSYDISEKLMGDMLYGGRDKIRRQIVEEVQVKSSDLMLEISCGTGINLRYLPHPAAYIGLDISMGMLRQCQRNLAKWGVEADFIQGSVESLPFRDASFDVVFHFWRNQFLQ